MGKRATITDLAREAGVSVATVDRVLNRRLPVREDTALRVVAAAESIGYHATGLLKQRITEVKQCTFGFLLQKRDDDFYRALGVELQNATKAATYLRGKAIVEFMDELVPSFIAAKIRELGARVDVLAVVAVDHPLVSEAVEEIVAKGKSVFTLLSDLTTPARSGYIGVDARKTGRTALKRFLDPQNESVTLSAFRQALWLLDVRFGSNWFEPAAGFRCTGADE